MKEKDTAKKRGRHRKKKIATYKDRWPERIKGKETKKTSDARNKENRQEEKEREGETEIETKKRKEMDVYVYVFVFVFALCVVFAVFFVFVFVILENLRPAGLFFYRCPRLAN